MKSWKLTCSSLLGLGVVHCAGARVHAATAAPEPVSAAPLTVPALLAADVQLTWAPGVQVYLWGMLHLTAQRQDLGKNSINSYSISCHLTVQKNALCFISSHSCDQLVKDEVILHIIGRREKIAFWTLLLQTQCQFWKNHTSLLKSVTVSE